ncbi:MAG: alpha/beta hydrolase, partial [Bacteroidota bacterium]
NIQHPMKKRLVKAVSTVFPTAVVNFAYKKLTNPQVKKLRDHELVILDQANKKTIKFGNFDIQTYEWAGGKDTVLLIHGWEGQAGNFADVIEKLIENDYTVYAFDAPSHGFSSRGKTSLFEFTQLVAVLIKKYEITKLISHSFGGVATTYALRNNPDIEIDKYALLTTPDKFSERISDLAGEIGVTNKVVEKLKTRLERETQSNVDELCVSEFVKSINVNQSMIIHDKNDKVIPINRSYNVHKNWKNNEFIEIENTGHFRILRTDHVIDRVLKFLA